MHILSSLVCLLAILPMLQACRDPDPFDLTLLRGVAVSDLDRDGNADILLASSDDDEGPDQHLGTVFRNLAGPRGSFSREQAVRVPGGEFERPDSVIVGDLDDDGLADFAIDNGSSVYLAFQRAGQPGSFSAPVPVAKGSYRKLLAIADLDHDGINDLAVADGDGMLAVHFQDSLNPGKYLPRIGLGVRASAAAVGDLDGDLVNDIALIDPDTDAIKILLQDPGLPGSYALAQQYSDGENLRAVAVVDFDGDGRLDLAGAFAGASASNIRGGLVVRLQDQAAPGEFPDPQIQVNDANGQGFAIGDLDNDGLADIAFTAHPFGAGVRISIAFQDSASPGNFIAAVKLDDFGFPHALTIADMDGDLRNDLVISDGILEIRYQRAAPGQFTGGFEIYDPN